MEDKMEVDEIEEDDKPKAKKSLKRGRKTKKSNTKSMLESSEIANDEKSNITEQETSPEVKDTTITSQNVVLNNATENVIIDESLALESPNKSIIKTEVATIVEDEKEKPEDSIITVKKEKIESIVEKINKVEETGSSEVVLVPVVSTTEVEEAPIVAVEEIEETKPVEEVTCSDEVQGAAPTFAENINETVDSVVEEITSEVAPVLAPADNSTDVVEAQVNSKEVVVEDSIASSNEVEKVEPVKQVNCSDEVQDVEPISKNDKEDEKNKLEEGMDCSDDVHKDTSITNIVEEVEPVAEAMKEVQVVASSVAISEEVKNVEPLEEINRTVEVLEPVKKFNEIEIILTEIKREKVEQEVPNKSSLKEVVTRKSESYTVEESKNIEERCESPDLMDESIVTIMDSPPPMNVSAHPKDSTFSPVVDISINDSRPTIDVPLLKRNNPLRTSTPLAPKLGLKSIAENQNSKRKLMLNPLEKSILKSNRRKRSLSMVEGDSFMQKRVMFISPTVMDIESIDHKMMASFIEEKENSSKFINNFNQFHFNSNFI